MRKRKYICVVGLMSLSLFYFILLLRSFFLILVSSSCVHSNKNEKEIVEISEKVKKRVTK